MQFRDAWPLIAAGLLAAGICEGIAAERPTLATAAFKTTTPATGQLRRTPTLRPPVVLLVDGPVLAEADVGIGTAASLIVEDRRASGRHGARGYLDVQHDAQAFADTPAIESLGNGRYRVTLQTSDRLPVGTYQGALQVRMCAESPCRNVIAGTSTSTPYQVTVRWANPGEWETFQRDAAHTGYVPVAIDPSRIVKVWERDGIFDDQGVVPSGVTTVAGKALLSYRRGDNIESWVLAALDDADGSVAWQLDFNANVLNDPGTSGNRVYVATTGRERTFLWSFDAADGTPRFQSTFHTQWSSVMAPTIAHGIAYTNGGYYGGGVYAFDRDDGMPLWSRFSGDDTASTPAIRDGKAYYYDSQALKIYDAFDGTVLSAIADPNNPPWSGYSLNGAAMVGSPDHVVAFSGTTGAAVNNGRFLVDYSPSAGVTRWSTAKKYSTHPATMDGVIYAGTDNPKSFDAIDEATGQVLWSWIPGTSDIRFCNNIVLTKNLAFVSTNRAVYAIDLATRSPVWSYPAPGTLSISGGGTLYLLEGINNGLTGLLHAFRLH